MVDEKKKKTTIEEQVDAYIKNLRKKTWSKGIENLIKEIKKDAKDECKDRLALAARISRLLFAFEGSLKGWKNWDNVGSMETLTEEQLKLIVSKLTKIILEFLKFDLEITKVKEEENFVKMREHAIKKLKKQAKAAKKGHKMYM